ncbi:MAG: hypothetical protein ACI923_002501 [Flavobacteriales bacterium]|jgi:hypothetical protein
MLQPSMIRSLRESKSWWRNNLTVTSRRIHTGRPLFGAAIFLLMSVLLTQCKRPEQDLGLGLQSEDDLLAVTKTDTLTLEAFNVLEDSLRTDELSLSLLGNYIDEFTGPVKTSIYTQLRLETPDIVFGTNPIADSLVLSLSYTNGIYGRLSPQYLEVLELQEDLYTDSAYYSVRDFTTDLISLIEPGDETHQFNINDQIFLSEDDSLNAQLRIHMKAELAERFITAGAEVYDSNENFQEFFKGIYIRSRSQEGGVATLNLLSGESAMTLFYHNDDDTLSFDYTINSLCARTGRFEHTFTGPLSGLNNDETIPAGNQIIVQAAAGAKAKVIFPHLDNFNAIETRTVNKAELIVPVTDGRDNRFALQSLLFCLTENADGNPVSLPGQLSSLIDIDGNYDAINNEYRFNISRWFQDYLNGNQAVNFIYIVSNNAGVAVTRVQLNGPAGSLIDPDRKMRLELTYSY